MDPEVDLGLGRGRNPLGPWQGAERAEEAAGDGVGWAVIWGL